ncbi:hypothetical protein CR513_38173, partial [Mucuna pruriens]
MPPSTSCGFSYYVAFVDAHTKFTWIYLLKTLVENQFSLTIKAVQSDWGGEFLQFTNFLTQIGVHHRVICPHTHHQNGTVECKHRHTVELGLTLLAQASLPLKYWDHAFLTSVYLIKRLPTSSLNFDIPFSELFGQFPDYSFLRVFGCARFLLLRPYHKNKFQFRSTECIFLGYSIAHKGHKCLSLDGKMSFSMSTNFPTQIFFPVSLPNNSLSAPADIPLPLPLDSTLHVHTTLPLANWAPNPNPSPSLANPTNIRPMTT